MTALTVGSLFSGIGGLDLGLERAGMRVIWQSEIDPYCCRVLRKHWPTVENYGDIKKIDWETVKRPNVICGGYPCQPFSTAGKRRGEEDPRHLWPWVRDAISRLRPDYAILENVRGHLSMGGLSVIGDLASIGYDAEWRIVSAASVGANHRRDRIIIVAYPGGERLEAERAEFETSGVIRSSENSRQFVAHADGGDSTNGGQCEALQSQDRGGGNDRGRSRGDTWQVSMGSSGQDSEDVAYPRSEWRLQRREGFESVNEEIKGHALRSAAYWATEPRVGRVAYGIPSRMDRLRGLGNAVVPQVAEVIGRLVVAHAETC